ncbi:MAG: fatty acid cis/trans isomerase, partial [Halioglobus sp.]
MPQYLKPFGSLFFVLVFSALALGCSDSSSVADTNTSEKVAVAEPAPGVSPTYASEIQPLFDNRCIACHGCIGSPCNVKLSSFRAVERGGFGRNPYSLHFDNFKRTGMDVHATTEGWRKDGFYPIVARGGNATENLAGSMISQLVTVGHQNNQPGFSRKALMSSNHRYKQSCQSTSDALASHLAANPAEGMPYGLPALDESQLAQIKQWVSAGSPGP